MSRIEEIRARIAAERAARIAANGHPTDDADQPSETSRSIAASMGYVEPIKANNTYHWHSADPDPGSSWLTLDALQQMMDRAFVGLTPRDLPFTHDLTQPTPVTIDIDGVEYRYHDLDPASGAMRLYRDNGIDPSTVRNDS